MSKDAYEIKKLECLPVDRRIVERNLATGTLARKDYDKYVSSLEDLVDQTELIELAIGDDETDEGEATPETETADEAADEAPSA